MSCLNDIQGRQITKTLLVLHLGCIAFRGGSFVSLLKKCACVSISICLEIFIFYHLTEVIIVYLYSRQFNPANGPEQIY